MDLTSYVVNAVLVEGRAACPARGTRAQPHERMPVAIRVGSFAGRRDWCGESGAGGVLMR
jgi:hypothetical protein